ncbi:glycosyltransferase family 2 protein [Pseudonocardia kunmingensis]|uniref:Glycosyl transferase family 2 n=1 Tax=Pseudonocardia kunmingensis TaxID=630975 RepID=A0A543DLT7_9PSEU|nr:glycosyltransferase [Pseudonocardia kunmingensis]TQM10225.1 glycosyl transferase family 2 [Pseudonocardia kunmingensis]
MSPWIAPPTPTWVGELDRHATVEPLVVDQRFGAARLLVTSGGTPVGVVELPLLEGRASVAALRHALETQLGDAPDPAAPPAAFDPVTVVVATRGRPDSVARCARALLAGDHPDITVLVVDNDPVDDRTAEAVRLIDDPRLRYVREARRGASVGRNRGLQEATTEIVAFTDDDTEPDRAWAVRIAGAFAADPEVTCVSGPVLAARLATAEELAADGALAWNKGFERRRFSLAEPPADSPIFPFSPGLFGIGANLAVRADVARGVGGFDEALGPGSPTHGGEDCEFLVRLVLAGHVLAYEPSAWVRHHHRPGPDALRAQLRGYAVGLGAFLTKIALDRRARAAAFRRLPAAVARLRHISAREGGAGDGMPTGSGRDRLRGLASGPLAYLRGRRAARRAGGRVPPLVADPPPAPSGSRPLALVG